MRWEEVPFQCIGWQSHIFNSKVIQGFGDFDLLCCGEEGRCKLFTFANVLSMILKLERLPEEHIKENSVTAPSSYSSHSRNVLSALFKLKRLLDMHIEEGLGDSSVVVSLLKNSELTTWPPEITHSADFKWPSFLETEVKIEQSIVETEVLKYI